MEEKNIGRKRVLNEYGDGERKKEQRRETEEMKRKRQRDKYVTERILMCQMPYPIRMSEKFTSIIIILQKCRNSKTEEKVRKEKKKNVVFI